MKLIQEINDSLLNRKRLTYEVEHANKATPKKDEVKKLVADKLKVDEKLIGIKYIKSNFGSTNSKVVVYLYNDEKTYNDIEVFKKKPKVKKDAKETKAKKQKTK